MLTNAIIATRLKETLKERGMSAAELARLADVKTSFVYDVLSGKSLHPSTITLARVASALGVPLPYLAGGEAVAPSPLHQQQAGECITLPFISATVSARGSAVIAEQIEKEGSYSFHYAWIREQLKTSPEHLKLMHITGDSMDPTLQDGDVVLTDTSKTTPSPPGIFIVFDGFGLVAKRLEIVPHSAPAMVRITSDNPQYAPYERLVAETRVVGRVVWFAREM